MQAIWMVAAAFFFAAMSACVRFASPYFDPLELIGYRGAIGMVFMAAMLRSRRISLATRVPWMHLWRNVIGVSAMTAWFYAIAHLPLATAITLNYMSSVWIAAFIVASTLLTGRLSDMRSQSPLVLAVLASFGGLILLLRPTLEPEQLFAGIIGLMGGMMAAMAYIQVAALGRVGEPEARTVFYFSLGGLVAGAAHMLVFGAHPINRVEAWWLLPIGIFASLGQLAMTRAYTHGSTIVVANLQYSGIVFGALLGLFLFGERIPPLGWLGMVIIIASGMAATVLRARTMENPPAEERS